MSLRVRKTKTTSGATAVQVVRYENRRAVVVKHVGSAHAEQELLALLEAARVWVEQISRQTSLLEKEEARTILISHAELVGVSHTFAYEVLCDVAARCGFDLGKDRLLIDLAIMRLIEPTSKLRAIELLDRYFGVSYSRRAIYETLPAMHTRKEAIQQAVIDCAVGRFDQNLSLVFYDVTTLYFESFTSDELRTPGFSKDNKPAQTQIMIGLLVTHDGFPLGYEIFPGNTFEGNTMITVLDNFVNAYNVRFPVVVADAAMLSQQNIAELKARGLSYIVGARLANLPATVIDKISATFGETDNQTKRLRVKGHDLIVNFEAKRYRKGFNDLEKQIQRAHELIDRNEPGRRAKFISKDNDGYTLNHILIDKTRKLLGIRGYYTNLPDSVLSDSQVIDHYHGLWRVEQAFRISKSDLQTRPIFHHKQQPIKAHILICFTALAIAKYIELATGASLRKTKDLLWTITEGTIRDNSTGQNFTLRTPTTPETNEFIRQLQASH
jgi:transposase